MILKRLFCITIWFLVDFSFCGAIKNRKWSTQITESFVTESFITELLVTISLIDRIEEKKNKFSFHRMLSKIDWNQSKCAASNTNIIIYVSAQPYLIKLKTHFWIQICEACSTTFPWTVCNHLVLPKSILIIKTNLLKKCLFDKNFTCKNRRIRSLVHIKKILNPYPWIFGTDTERASWNK